MWSSIELTNDDNVMSTLPIPLIHPRRPGHPADADADAAPKHAVNEFRLQMNCPIEIRVDPDRGRYAVASRDIAEGERVLCARPFGLSIYHKCRKQACHACAAYTISRSSLAGGYTCNICGLVTFCASCYPKVYDSFHVNLECPLLKQLNDQLPKKDMCAFILKNSNGHRGMDSYERSDILDLGKWIINFCIKAILLGSKRDDQDVLNSIQTPPSVSDVVVAGYPSYESVTELVQNSDNLPPIEVEQLKGLYFILTTCFTVSRIGSKHNKSHQPHTFQDNSRHTKWSSSLPQTLSELIVSVLPTQESFIQLLAARQCNGFGLWDSANECLGQSLYPFASYFNHACEPNIRRETGLINLDEHSCHPPQQPINIDNMNSSVSPSFSHDLTSSSPVSSSPTHHQALQLLQVALEREPMISFYSRRTVLKEESLTISYIDASQSAPQRKEQLERVYFFECRCVMCCNVGSSPMH